MVRACQSATKKKQSYCVLQAHPVLQCAHIVANVQLARGTHAAQHAAAFLWVMWVRHSVLANRQVRLEYHARGGGEGAVIWG